MSSENIDNALSEEQARQFLDALREGVKVSACYNSGCTCDSGNVMLIRIAGRSFIIFACDECFAAVHSHDDKLNPAEFLMLSRENLAEGDQKIEPAKPTELSGAPSYEAPKFDGIRSADQDTNLVRLEQVQNPTDSNQSLEAQPHSPSNQRPNHKPCLDD